MMNRRKNILTAGLLLMVLSLACADSPTDSGGTSLNTYITVIVKDTAEVPLNGVKISTYPKTISTITDKNGIAYLEDIPNGEYQIVASRSDIPIFYETVSVRYQPATVLFMVATEVTVNLQVTHASGISLEGSKISTQPPTVFVTTDQEGYSLMERIPVKKYTFIVKRDRASAYIQNRLITVQNGLVQDMDLVVEEQDPRVFIETPSNRTYKSIFDTEFSADGYDFEDGDLPSEAFVWTSDIDGELGTGKELYIDRMSIGHHTITLTGHDSGMHEDTASIELVLYFYAKGSFFPIPHNGYWTYENTPQTFTQTENGRNISYELQNISVVMDDVNERTSVMTYLAYDEYEKTTTEYEYTVTDILDNDADSFYVTRTIETISLHNTKLPESAKSTVNIETVYDSKLPLIDSHFEISPASNFSFETLAEAYWQFPGTNYGSQVYREEYLISTETTYLGSETITTPVRTFETGKIRMTQGETERVWWLAKGYGVVQFSYNTMGPIVTATMIDTNLDELQDDEIGGEDMPSARLAPARIAGTVPASAGPPPEEWRQRVELFRSMAPRPIP